MSESRTEVVLLDTGVLSLVTHPRQDPAIAAWIQRLVDRGARVLIPAICDYELRRELMRADKEKSIQRLDRLEEALGYLPLSAASLHTACRFWADARKVGKPTADDKALDGDVILAAQAKHCGNPDANVVVATTNVGHLSRFIDAREWHQIYPA